VRRKSFGKIPDTAPVKSRIKAVAAAMQTPGVSKRRDMSANLGKYLHKKKGRKS